ncbi:hypothetical protein THIAE_07890 [Thiomicrospira aerophila AL3]|uniref:Uncharacterized protein n=1 Tax=Thiomicrospira aerophila AL3 TaxID=717772 RepID=W0DZD3_9GAMM|nr:hypothetical protein [Thiomicrospira aerophila]AHF02344.1 hypothetical protein THIAE_07890 [Thiomicrospira aerophila AL3]
MSAIEFKTTALGEHIDIPAQFKSLFKKPVKITVRLDEDSETQQSRFEQNYVEVENVFGEINLDLSKFKFDREQANER